MPKEPKDTPLQVGIEGDELVIRIGIETLAFCAAHQPDFNDAGLYECPYLKIDDVRGFAKDVVRGLLNEEEDGSTTISRCIDEACLYAVEDGSEFVDYEYLPNLVRADNDDDF
jgi:hypothetical protein